MTRRDKLIDRMRRSPQNVRYDELVAVCIDYFGRPRQHGTSHAVFRTPWEGEPRVLIQEGNGGAAKAYQVAQVLDAIDKLTTEGQNNG